MEGRRILVLVVNDVTYDQRLIKIYSALASAGYDITIFGRDYQQQYKDDFNFKVQRWAIKPASGPRMYWNMNQRFIKEGAKEKYDIIVSNDFDTLYAGYHLARKCKAKWVFDAHEYFTEVPELEHKWIKKSIWHQLGKWLIPKTDLTLTVNASLSEILSKKYRKQFWPIYNVPNKSMSQKIGTTNSYILYQGAVNKGRGLEVAINSMKQINDRELWIAGSGDLFTSLQQWVKNEGLEHRVKFLGRKTPQELVYITQNAWVGLNLLEGNSLNYYYSLANKFFDYAQAGIPSINMNFPEYQKLVSTYQTGLLLDKLNEEVLLEAYEQLKDPKVYSKYVEGGYKMIADFHWQKEAEKVIQLFSAL